MQQNFNEFLNQQLNAQQQQAVLQKDGALLVIAGAGSGKTRIITARIINLIVNEKCNPASIVALTFTNKAAQEMKERITHFLGAAASSIFIGTFHSYCLLLLRSNAQFLKMPIFTILDADDQQQLLQSLIKRNVLQKKITAKNLAYSISFKKNNLNKGVNDTNADDPVIDQLYKAYEKEKRVSKSLDFDDLLLEVLNLFSTQETFKTIFQQRVRHILVDEYQDTNTVQHELLKQMTLSEKRLAVDSLCAVGDEDQSIYSWRGATVENMVNFKKDFPDTITIKIEQNYRSVQPILTIANQIIQHNSNRNEKNLWSARDAQNRSHTITCVSDYQEADLIAQAVKAYHRTKRKSAIGILYRAHYQSRIIEETLLKNGIAYTIIGGIQFYERKEIKDLLAYLKLIANPFDRVSFFRVINIPARGLGEKFEEDVQKIWNTQPLYAFNDVLNHLIATGQVSGKKAGQVKKFISLLAHIAHDHKPSSTLTHVIYETDYYAYLKEQFEPKEAESRIDNVKELLRAAKHFEDQSIKSTTLDFLHEIALMQEKIKEHTDNEEQLFLMTLHSAKGLEFDFVLLAGLEEGIFPSNHSLYNPEAIEEERRLLYVGITRAKEYLVITHARYRYSFGSMSDQRASRFLSEVPEQLSKKVEVSRSSQLEQYQLFDRWFNNKTEAVRPAIITFSMPGSTGQKQSSTSVTQKTSAATNQSFKKLQSVNHAKFGVGIIQEVEEKNPSTIYITAKFKSGVKKIKSDFVERV